MSAICRKVNGNETGRNGCGEENDEPEGSGRCLVLCSGTDSARLAVRTGMTGTETSLSRWNEGTR